MVPATLDGLRVVDLGARASTAWCSRLLADYGADVVMVDAPDGHELRRHPPFGPDGRSTTARYFLANKRTAAPASREGLVAAADVIVAGAEAPQLADANPNAVVCSITPGGLDGAYAQFNGNELTAYARSGWASVNGLKGRPPLKGSGYQTAYQAGTLAFGAVVAALLERCSQRRQRSNHRRVRAGGSGINLRTGAAAGPVFGRGVGAARRDHDERRSSACPRRLFRAAAVATRPSGRRR